MGNGVIRNLIACYKVICDHGVIRVVERVEVRRRHWAAIGVLASAYEAVEGVQRVRLDGIIRLKMETM